MQNKSKFIITDIINEQVGIPELMTLEDAVREAEFLALSTPGEEYTIWESRRIVSIDPPEVQHRELR